MAFDYKKEFKELYASKRKPEIVNVPAMNFVAVRGAGDPNEEGGAYAQAIEKLYAVSYTLKMSYKTDYEIDGFFQYVVPPLEGLWWQEGVNGVDYARKEKFCWIALIRLPEFICAEHLDWAKAEVLRKKGLDCADVEFAGMEEGLCVQMLHVGSYDDEPATVAAMDAFIEEQGYANDFSSQRMHHEVYLSDPRRTAPEKLKTIVRHPVKLKAGE